MPQQLDARDKRAKIIEQIRSAIVTGELAAGERLPTNEELGRKYGVSGNTVQVAFTKLIQDGFLVAKRKAGTFVSANPPHLTQYAMVFEKSPSSNPMYWSRYYEGLCKAADALREELQPRQLRLHFEVNGHADNEAHQMLCHGLREKCLAGLIFPNMPDENSFEGSPLLDAPGIARAVVTSMGNDAAFPRVIIDGQSFVDNAVRYLRESGVRRVAVLAPPGFPVMGAWDDGLLRKVLCERLQLGGLEAHPRWVQLPDAIKPVAVQALVELLVSVPVPGRPEAIILCDDYYLDPVITALACSPGDALRNTRLVSYCNFPTPAYTGPARVQCLGFDMHQVLRSLVHLIDQQIAGQQPKDVSIEAEFAAGATDSHS